MSSEKNQDTDITDPIKWKELGNDLFNKGEYEDAIKCYYHAIQLNPDFIEAWNNLGLSLLKLGKIEEAKQCDNKVKSLKKDSSDNLSRQKKFHKLSLKSFNTANILLFLGVIFVLSIIIASFSTNGMDFPNKTIGTNRSDSSNNLENVDNIETSMSAVTNNSNMDWQKKGNLLFFQGKYNEAIDEYNKALEINPNDSHTWLYNGRALDNLGRYDEALAAYNKALEINPNFLLAWTNKGNVLLSLGRYEDAITAYNKALDIDPNDAVNWNEKGVSLSYLGRYDEALAAYNKALEITPENAITWNNKGNALYGLKIYEEALTAYTKASEINPNIAIYWQNKGYSLFNLKRYEEALNAYNTALQIEPNNEKILQQKDYTLQFITKNQGIESSSNYQSTTNNDITRNEILSILNSIKDSSNVWYGTAYSFSDPDRITHADLKDILINDDKSGLKWVTIKYYVPASWNEKHFLTGSAITGTAIFEYLFKNNKIGRVTVISSAPFLDRYGNENIREGLSITMSRSTANKVNWENLPMLVMGDYRQLLYAVDSYVIYSGISTDAPYSKNTPTDEQSNTQKQSSNFEYTPSKSYYYQYDDKSIRLKLYTNCKWKGTIKWDGNTRSVSDTGSGSWEFNVFGSDKMVNNYIEASFDCDCPCSLELYQGYELKKSSESSHGYASLNYKIR